ncbi:riboflavine-aldehyde-forming enzyme, partial [Agrocybe pediades]
ATFYTPGLGNCGKKNRESDFVVALSQKEYHRKNHCGKKIRIHYGSKSVDALIADSCMSCKPDDIDLSPVVFDRLASRDAGRIKVTWDYL